MNLNISKPMFKCDLCQCPCYINTWHTHWVLELNFTNSTNGDRLNNWSEAIHLQHFHLLLKIVAHQWWVIICLLWKLSTKVWFDLETLENVLISILQQKFSALKAIARLNHRPRNLSPLSLNFLFSSLKCKIIF